jgi:hypothetical protein
MCIPKTLFFIQSSTLPAICDLDPATLVWDQLEEGVNA